MQSSNDLCGVYRCYNDLQVGPCVTAVVDLKLALFGNVSFPPTRA